VRQPDITKARELLGWEPTIELHEGLVLTIENARSGAATDASMPSLPLRGPRALVAHR